MKMFASCSTLNNCKSSKFDNFNWCFLLRRFEVHFFAKKFLEILKKMNEFDFSKI